MEFHSPNLLDHQQAPVVAYCDRCGVDIYGEPNDDGFGAMLCQRCEEALAERDP